MLIRLTELEKFRLKASLMFLYMHGGIAIFVYIIFYLTIFGLDSVRWMFINAALGIIFFESIYTFVKTE